jgi:hypothetical protein
MIFDILCKCILVILVVFLVYYKCERIARKGKPYEPTKPPLFFFMIKSVGLFRDCWEIVEEFEKKNGRPPYKLEVG